MSQDPLIKINDIFVEHNIACRIAFDISTRGIPASRRPMIYHQIRHAFPDYRVTLHSDHFRLVAAEQVEQ
jgi:hypothetical protein